MNLWPQIAMAALLVVLIIGSFVRHGKPVDPKPINAMYSIWISFVLFCVLGAGGFWHAFGW
jgi:hypothetical protein